jgi:hypothetical protein
MAPERLCSALSSTSIDLVSYNATSLLNTLVTVSMLHCSYFIAAVPPPFLDKWVTVTTA